MSKSNGRKPDNTQNARGPGGKWRKGGPSPNPGGRPKSTTSITYYLKRYGAMAPAEMAAELEAFARELKQIKGDAPLAAIAAARLWLSQVYEPDGRLMGHLLDRVDGKLAQTVYSGTLDQLAELLRADPQLADDPLLAAALTDEERAQLWAKVGKVVEVGE